MKPSACQHCFHDHCMMQWVESSNKNNRKCPLCREKIETIEQQVFQNGKQKIKIDNNYQIYNKYVNKVWNQEEKGY